MRRHALGALVAAVGWLLMAPPLIKDGKSPGGYRLDSNAKIGDWNQLSAHDTATDCERARSQRALDAIQMTQQLSSKKEVLDEPLVTEAMHALCVPADYIYGSPAGDEGHAAAAPALL
jgi:hypothetical protein